MLSEFSRYFYRGTLIQTIFFSKNRSQKFINLLNKALSRAPLSFKVSELKKKKDSDSIENQVFSKFLINIFFS